MIKNFRKSVNLALICAFIGSSLYGPPAQAGEMVMPLMPIPGAMVHLSPQYIPAHLQGITIHPDDALQFDFLIHRGEGQLDNAQKRTEYHKLIKYFLASLTIPDDDQWVNLSPYEKNRIIQRDFGNTEMGRDLLTQDYLLKQITASLMYPESGLGKQFWAKVYERAWKEFGSTDIPVNTFNKVWITPDEATVYESGNTAYILKSHLKVMLEEDYLSLAKHSAITGGQPGDMALALSPSTLPSEPTSEGESTPGKSRNDVPVTHTLASKIVKQIIIPELEKEVNEGKNFSMLRQIYSGMVLATWYKRALKKSLLGQVYADKSKVKGVDQDPRTNLAIYHKYIAAFRKGVFNYIKEDVDTYSQEVIPRKYFAGGFKNDPNAEKVVTAAMITTPAQAAMTVQEYQATQPNEIDVARAAMVGTNEAMTSGGDHYGGFNFHDYDLLGNLIRDMELQLQTETMGQELRGLIREVTRPLTTPQIESLMNLTPPQMTVFERWIAQGQGRTAKLQLAREMILDLFPGRLIQVPNAVNPQEALEGARSQLRGAIHTIAPGFYPNHDEQDAEYEEGLRLFETELSQRFDVKPDTRGKPGNFTVQVFLDLAMNTAAKRQINTSAAMTVEQGRWLKDEVIKGAEKLIAGSKQKNTVIAAQIHDFLVNEAQMDNVVAVSEMATIPKGTLVHTSTDLIPIAKARELVQAGNGFLFLFEKNFILVRKNASAAMTTHQRILKAAGIALLGTGFALSQQMPNNDHYGESTVSKRLAQLLKGSDLKKSKINAKAIKILETLRSKGAMSNSLTAAQLQPILTALEFRDAVGHDGKKTIEVYLRDKLRDKHIITYTHNDEIPVKLERGVRYQNGTISIDLVGRTVEIFLNEKGHEVLVNIIEHELKQFRNNGQGRPQVNPGGIDLNSANLGLIIKRDGLGVPLPLALQDMAQLSRIQGFRPNIITIKPMTTNLPILSELQQKLRQ